jgi:hypothetical protein
MPTTPGCQPSPAAQTSGRVEPACLGLRQCRVAHAGFDLAPVGVERVEPPRQRHGLFRVVGGQQARAEIGLPIRPPALTRGPRTKPR